MNKEKKANNGSMELFTIMTDIPLWNFLVQERKKTAKYTRVQAFGNLIDRQRIALLENNGDKNLRGTVQDMAATWGWDRETVTRFLKTLSQLGVLTIITEKNRKAYRLKYKANEESVAGVA